jgi:hypothetical protein
MSLSKEIKVEMLRVICGGSPMTNSPFIREEGDFYLKFDRLEITSGPLDDLGRGTKDVGFFYKGAKVYTLSLGFAGPQDTMSLTGVEGRTKISFSC